MNVLDEWCDREARQAAANPTLAEALLGNRSFRYVIHRIRFLAARVPIRVALHFAEVVLLGSVFPLEELRPVFAIRAAMAISSAAWWGALEPLREEVRDDVSRRAFTHATNTIRLWLLRSVEVGFAQLAVALAWIHFGPSPFHGFSIFDAYALAAGLRVLLETVARTYAAGIGAIRRVPRPFWSGVPGDVLDICGAILLWPWAGTWSFAIALLAAGAVRALTVVFYARRAYRASKLKGVVFRRMRRKTPRFVLPVARGIFEGAIGNMATQLDAWILLALAATARTEEEAFVAAAFHVLRPLLSASIGWTRSFYLDLKKLEIQGRLLRTRFERLLLRLAIALAIATAIMVVAVSALLYGGVPRVVVLWLFPFLVARSVFALYQLQGFSYGRTRYLLASAAVAAAGLAAIVMIRDLEPYALPALTLVLGSFVVVAGAPEARADAGTPELTAFYRFLSLLGDAQGPTRVGAALLRSRLSVPAGKVAQEISRIHRVPTAVWGNRHVLWFESSTVLPRETLMTASGGTIETLRVGPTAADGKLALVAALDAHVLDSDLERRLRHTSEAELGDLGRAFLKDFPDGVILDARRGFIDLRALAVTGGTPSAALLRGAINEIFRLSAGPSGSGPRDVPARLAVLSPGGEPELIFVVPRAIDAAVFATWRHRIEDANFAASLGLQNLPDTPAEASPTQG